MKRFIKIAAICIAVLVILLVAAAVAVGIWFDPNEHKALIEQKAEEATGRKLTINGDISLTFFPWLGVSLPAMSLADAPGFGDAPFASIQKVVVRVKLWPLLSKKLEAGRIIVEGLSLRAVKNKEGKANWEDLAKAAPAGDTGKKEKAEKPAPGGGELPEIRLEGLSIKDAAVTYIDLQKGQEVKLSGVNLSTGAVEPGKPVDVEISFAMASTNPALTADGRLFGILTMEAGSKNLSFTQARLEITAQGDIIPGKKLSADAGGDFILAGQDLDVKGLTATLQGISLNGEAHVSDYAGKAAFSGSFDLPSQDIGNLLALLGDKAPKPAGKGISRIGLTADFSGDKNNASIKNLILTLDDQRIWANAAIKDFSGALAFSGTVESAGLSIRPLMATAGVAAPNTTDPQALSSLSFGAEFSGDKNNAAVKSLVAKLDETTAKGSAEVKNLKKPAIRFALAVDSINADRYLPPAGKEEKSSKGPETSGPQGGAAGSGKLPVEPLRKIDAKGELTIGKLIIQKLTMTEMKAVFTAKDGLIDLAQAQAKLYGGSASIPAKVDARQEALAISAAPKLSGISFGPLLKDFMGKAPLTGTGNFSANIATRGVDAPAMTKALNGELDMSVKDGAVQGLNVANKVRDAWAAFQGKSQAAQAQEATEFVALTASAKITDGVLSNQDLSLASPAMKVTGKGTANLVEKSVDYVITANLDKGFTGLGSISGVDLTNIPVPIHIKGGFDKLSFLPDSKGLAAALAEKKGAEITKKVEEALPADVKKALPGLFGGESGDSGGDGEKKESQPRNLLKGLFK